MDTPHVRRVKSALRVLFHSRTSDGEQIAALEGVFRLDRHGEFIDLIGKTPEAQKSTKFIATPTWEAMVAERDHMIEELHDKIAQSNVEIIKLKREVNTIRRVRRELRVTRNRLHELSNLVHPQDAPAPPKCRCIVCRRLQFDDPPRPKSNVNKRKIWTWDRYQWVVYEKQRLMARDPKSSWRTTTHEPEMTQRFILEFGIDIGPTSITGALKDLAANPALCKPPRGVHNRYVLEPPFFFPFEPRDPEQIEVYSSSADAMSGEDDL